MIELERERFDAILALIKLAIDPHDQVPESVIEDGLIHLLTNLAPDDLVVAEKTAASNVPPPEAGTRIAVVTGGTRIPLGTAGKLFWTGSGRRGPACGFNAFGNVPNGPEVGETVWISRRFVTLREPMTSEFGVIRDVSALSAIDWALSKVDGDGSRLKKESGLLRWISGQFDALELPEDHFARARLAEVLVMTHLKKTKGAKPSRWKDV